MNAVIEIEIDPAIEESSFGVRFPNRHHWSKIETETRSSGMYLIFDTLANGCGGVAIALVPTDWTSRGAWGLMEDKKVLGFVASRKTLTEIRDAINFALQVYSETFSEKTEIKPEG